MVCLKICVRVGQQYGWLLWIVSDFTIQIIWNGMQDFLMFIIFIRKKLKC